MEHKHSNYNNKENVFPTFNSASSYSSIRLCTTPNSEDIFNELLRCAKSRSFIVSYDSNTIFASRSNYLTIRNGVSSITTSGKYEYQRQGRSTGLRFHMSGFPVSHMSMILPTQKDVKHYAEACAEILRICRSRSRTRSDFNVVHTYQNFLAPRYAVPSFCSEALKRDYEQWGERLQEFLSAWFLPSDVCIQLIKEKCYLEQRIQLDEREAEKRFLREHPHCKTIELFDLSYLYDENLQASYIEQHRYLPHLPLYLCSNLSASIHRHHVLEDQTAFLPTVDGLQVPINVSYCNNCNQHLINRFDYEYATQQKNIMARFISDRNHPDDYGGKDDESILKLNGYTVRKNSLSEDERFLILQRLCDYKIVRRAYITDSLQRFIAINGSIKRNAEAVTKWETDLNRIRAYKILGQEQLVGDGVFYRGNRVYL